MHLDSDQQKRILPLKAAIVERFDREQWLELGMLTGCLNEVRGHDRLLRNPGRFALSFTGRGSFCSMPVYNIGMIQIIPLLTAFGLGSIVTALIQSWLAQRSKHDERRFLEKQSAYIGLLEAYHRAVMEDNDETAKAFGYWQMRCALVAPQSVRNAIRRIPETNGDQPERSKALDALEAAMRQDLGIERE